MTTDRTARPTSAELQGSRMSLAGDDPEHVVVVPGGLLAPAAKAGLAAAVAGDQVEGDPAPGDGSGSEVAAGNF